MQKFFTDTLESRFIKHVLHESFLPTIKTVREGDYIFENNCYIYKLNVIKCTSSGYLFPENAAIQIEAKFSNVSTYIPFTLYPKYCNRFISNNVYYDTDTHKRLGKYLRFLRDIYDLNLMPFYNCYAGESVNNISLTTSGYNFNYNRSVKTYSIPIEFNTTYTICIDCPSQMLIAPAFLFNGNIETVSDVDLNTQLLENSSSSIKLCELTTKYFNSTFNRPIKFSVPCTNSILNDYEKHLNLLIQVPISNNSSMVVLEGDYTGGGANPIINLDGENVLEDKYLNNVLLSDLQLMQINDYTRYAFSDRLIEYLLRHVISSRETIGMNIQRVQLASNILNYPNMKLGIWQPEMRYLLYKAYISNKSTRKLDINGFVDRDMEKYINAK